ncbi:MAG: sulfotransferase family protein [Acidimicrobiales bacterium]
MARPAPQGSPGEDHTLAFIGGLHRSGTTLLARLLGRHPLVSGFNGTGAKEDEGQHLQSVYQPANALGGEGRFGFQPGAQLVEAPPERAQSEAATLFGQWSRHWDLQRPVLVEKSPPNLVRMRYLQSLFPRARFVVIMRHPVEVALASRKRVRSATLWPLLRHWFVCHDIFAVDAPSITRLLVLRYEDLLAEPQRTLDGLLGFVGLSPSPAATASDVSATASARYRQQWDRLSTRLASRPVAGVLVRRFEADAQRYGYSMRDLSVARPWPLGI